MLKKLLSCILCTVILCGVLSVTTLAVSTGKLSDAPEQVDGVMWFPAHPERQNDYLWEVEFDDESSMYQAFLWDPATNYLDITYHDDGAVTFSRNQNGKDEYWPSVRTFATSDYPYMKLTTADTLYFDFTVARNTTGAVVMTFNGLDIRLNGVIAEACGVSIKNSDTDLPAGTYKGSLHLRDAFDDIADEGGTGTSSAGATVLSELGDDKIDVPTVTLYVVGGRDASITMRALYMSAASDKNGKNCTYADAAMVYGLGFYDGEDVPPCDTPNEPEVENEDVESNVSDGLVTSTAAQSTASNDDGGFDWLPIIVIAVSAVVVVGGTIALIGALKK